MNITIKIYFRILRYDIYWFLIKNKIISCSFWVWIHLFFRKAALKKSNLLKLIENNLFWILELIKVKKSKIVLL